MMELDIEKWLRYPKIDMHCHVWNLANEKEEQVSSEQLILAGEMLGITEFWCSSPIIGGLIASVEKLLPTWTHVDIRPNTRKNIRNEWFFIYI